jgi:hypothetical protein
MIEFDEFEIETVTFEVRYDPALMIWDRAGAIWTNVVSQFPELKWHNAAPTQQIFESRDVRAVVELEAMRVVCRGKDAIKRQVEVANAVLKSCSENLGISTFTRIGFREIRIRKVDTLESALIDLGPIVPTPMLSSFIAGSKPKTVVVSVKHEGEASGLTAGLKLDLRELKVTIPWEFKERLSDAFPKELLLTLDSDYFTVGTTRREAFSVEDWAKQANRTIAKHWKGIIG